MEIWKDIPGYEGIYQVSNTGKVRSVDRLVKCKNGLLRNIKGKLLSKHLVYLYELVALYKNGKRKDWCVHELVLMSFDKCRPIGMECRHLDGNGRNNHIDNLKWGTKLENALDKHIHGTTATGSIFPHSKLKKESVLAIRASKLKTKELADKYNVSQNCIRMVKNHKTWKHI